MKNYNNQFQKKHYYEKESSQKWNHNGYDELIREEQEGYDRLNKNFSKKKKYEDNYKKSQIYSSENTRKCYKIKETEINNEDKISNVSTSFSSKEKTLEEEVNTPILKENIEIYENLTPIYSFKILFEDQNISFEINNEDQIEEKFNIINIQNEILNICLKIQIIKEILDRKIFNSSQKIQKIFDSLLDAYEIGRKKINNIEKIDC